MGVWMLVANPERYRIAEALTDLPRLGWDMETSGRKRKKQYARELRPGDTAYVWQTGKRAGIIARGTIQTALVPISTPPEEEPYVLDSEIYPYGYEYEGIWFDVDHVLPSFLLESELVEMRPELSNMDVTRFRNRTVSKVRPSEAYALAELFDAHLRWFPTGTAEFDPETLLDTRARATMNAIVREGQPEFRRRVLDAFEGRCAITGCDVRSVLQAAQIGGYRGAESNHVANGLSLRSDVHILFDSGRLAIDSAGYTVLVHPALAHTCYGELQGTQLRLPRDVTSRPSKKALDDHRKATGL